LAAKEKTPGLHQSVEVRDSGLLVRSIAVDAIILTIILHANQPLPQWPYHITINGLLSIYSIVLRGCIAYILSACIAQLQWTWFSSEARPLYDVVRFDEATRGPWGSVKWLCRHHIRQPLTAIGSV
jgi:hypothetical protein